MPPPEPTMPTQRIIADFEGAVASAPASPAINCKLSGVDRALKVPLEVHFSGARSPSGIPGAQRLENVRVSELSGGDEPVWLVEAASINYRLHARAVQVHRMGAAAFYAALPGERLRLGTRAGWALLLNVLRIPGAARLIGWLRSPRA
jgi:hypothetical protein